MNKTPPKPAPKPQPKPQPKPVQTASGGTKKPPRA